MRCASCEYRLEQGKMQSKTRKEMQNMREVIQKDLKHYFANIMKQTRKSKKTFTREDGRNFSHGRKILCGFGKRKVPLWDNNFYSFYVICSGRCK